MMLLNHACPRCARNFGIDWDAEPMNRLQIICSSCSMKWIAYKDKPTISAILENLE